MDNKLPHPIMITLHPGGCSVRLATAAEYEAANPRIEFYRDDDGKLRSRPAPPLYEQA